LCQQFSPSARFGFAAACQLLFSLEAYRS